MDSRKWNSPGFHASLILLLLRSPISAIADLTTSIIPPTPVLELRQATITNNDFFPTSTNASTNQGNDDPNGIDNDPAHVFNYYFLLIAITIAVLLLGFVFAGRRRKRKAMRHLNTRQEALRRDLEGWPRGRPGPPGVNTGQSSRWATGTRNWRSRNDNGVIRHDEGLDDLGEAPPPYNPGDKPPSIAVGGRADYVSEGEAVDSRGELSVPLRTLARNGTNPPGYFESISNNDSEESVRVTRTELAVTPTTPRSNSDSRRLLSATDSSSH